MMISPQSYIEDKKYWSVEKLNMEKNRLKTDIEQYKPAEQCPGVGSTKT